MDSSGAREDVTTPESTHRGVTRSRHPISVAAPYNAIALVPPDRPDERIDPPGFGSSVQALQRVLGAPRWPLPTRASQRDTHTKKRARRQSERTAKVGRPEVSIWCCAWGLYPTQEPGGPGARRSTSDDSSRAWSWSWHSAAPTAPLVRIVVING